MTELARCPCGQVPRNLIIDGDTDRPKWARCCGSCCYEWWLEYRNQYHDLSSDDALRIAEKAWNEAPRGIT